MGTYQTVSSIKVLDKDRLLIRFKDGTGVEQAIEHIERQARRERPSAQGWSAFPIESEPGRKRPGSEKGG